MIAWVELLLDLRFARVEKAVIRKPKEFLSRNTDKHTLNSEARVVGFEQAWSLKQLLGRQQAQRRV
jgi:hypothetical protein